MANGLPKKVVLKKPKIKKPINIKDIKKIHTNEHQPHPNLKDNDELDIPDSKDEPVIVLQQNENGKSRRKLIIKPPETPLELPIKERTFDERFLDKMDIKSRITKDTITQSKIQKQKTNQTRATKKLKRKLTSQGLISMMTFIILLVWIVTILRDYFSGNLDNSLATFMYVVAIGLFTLVALIWFMIEIIKRDENNSR